MPFLVITRSIVEIGCTCINIFFFKNWEEEITLYVITTYLYCETTYGPKTRIYNKSSFMLFFGYNSHLKVNFYAFFGYNSLHSRDRLYMYIYSFFFKKWEEEITLYVITTYLYFKTTYGPKTRILKSQFLCLFWL